MIHFFRDLDKTCEDIARISERDAETYRRHAMMAQQILPMFASGLYAPPMPFGAFTAMMDQSDEGRFMLGIMQRSALDVVTQSFESELVRIALVRLVAEHLQMPDELGVVARISRWFDFALTHA